MDNRVQQGRDPEWRLAFEHRLGTDARTRIRQAVNHRSGLTAGFSQVLASAPCRRHDPGVTLVQLAIVSTVTVTFKKQGGATRL
jgi:hypothetical protein